MLLLLFETQRPVEGAGTVLFNNGRAIDADADGPAWSVAADLDGDGDEDVLVCLPFADSVTWYENEDGKGTFAESAVISTATNGPR